MTEKAYFTPSELAARWRITRTTVYRMGQTGELPATKISGSRRISAEIVRAYEESCRVQGHDASDTSPAMDGQAFFDPAALAERWGLHRTTVYRMFDRNELTYYRIRGSIRVPASVVHAYERANGVAFLEDAGA